MSASRYHIQRSLEAEADASAALRDALRRHVPEPRRRWPTWARLLLLLLLYVGGMAGAMVLVGCGGGEPSGIDYGKGGDGRVISFHETRSVRAQEALVEQLRRIADALERAYPKPVEAGR